MKDETVNAMTRAFDAGYSSGAIDKWREGWASAMEALEESDEMIALRADAESHRMRMKNCDCQQEGLCHYCRTGEERGA